MAKWEKTNPPWERQEEESSQAFEAFISYRDLGAERNLRAVTQKLHKSLTIIGRWSRDWNWVERARIWDNELDRQAKAEAAKEVRKMRERQTKTAMLMQKKAIEALDKLDVSELSPKEILSFIIEASKLERNNRYEEAEFDTTTGRKVSNEGGSASIASIILEAYKRRKEGDS